MSGPMRYEVWQSSLANGSGTYVRGHTWEETVQNLKRHLRQHQHTLADSEFIVLDENGTELAYVKQPRRWREIEELVT